MKTNIIKYISKTTTIFLAVVFLIPQISQADVIPTSRRVDWQGNVGVKINGTEGIPNRTTIYTTLTPNGTDDTAQIQNAISACPSGQVVKLSAGTFKISSQIVVKSNITIRGEGMGKTIIQGLSGLSIYMSGIISFQSAGHSWDLSYWQSTPTAAVNLDSGYTKGSTILTTASAHGLKVGEYVLIDQLNSDTSNPPVTTTDSKGCSVNCGRCLSGCGSDNYVSGTRSLAQLGKVAAVPSSTQLTLEVPLYRSYDASLSPQIIKVAGMTENSGLEDLTIDNQTSNAHVALSMDAAANCWMLRTEVIRTNYILVDLYHVYRATISSSIFRGTDPPSGPAIYYGMMMAPAVDASLFENTIS